MSKKLIVRGKSLRITFDPTLARPHKKGAVVEYVQLAKDSVWGSYQFIHYPRAYLLLSQGAKAYRKTMKLLTLVRKLPIQKTNYRHIPNDLRDKLEIYSRSFLYHTKTGLDYLASEIIQGINNIRVHRRGLPKYQWDKMELVEKLRLVMVELDIQQPISSQVIEIFKRRDIAEHPTQIRMYNAELSGWENVHLAWVLSGKMDSMLKEVAIYANTVWNAFEEYKKKYDGPVTLTGVQRGLKSLDPVKKPIT